MLIRFTGLRPVWSALCLCVCVCVCVCGGGGGVDRGAVWMCACVEGSRRCMGVGVAVKG